MNRLNHFVVALLIFSITVSCGNKKSSDEDSDSTSTIQSEQTTDQQSDSDDAKKSNSDGGEERPRPAFSFEHMAHDFGTISEGDKVSHSFTFTNTGKAPLIIQNVRPSCGCTVSDWSKEPVPVGGKGYVRAEFDSNGKPNIQNKTITVTANTNPRTTVLRFNAMVTPSKSKKESK